MRNTAVSRAFSSRPAVSSFARILFLLIAGLLLPLLWPGVLQHLFSTTGFMLDPHDSWPRALTTLHVGSDLLIGVSYTVIAIILAFIVYQNREALPFDWVLLAFGLFIVACGLTHVMHVVVRFLPIYWFDAYVRALTAVVSVATALALPPLIPKVRQLLTAGTELQRKERQLQQSLGINQTLLEIVQLPHDGDAVHTARQVLLKLGEVLPVDWLGIGIQSGEDIHFTGIWSSPGFTGILTQTELPPVQRGVGITWRAVDAQAPVFIDDYAAQPGAQPLYLREGLSSLALVPLTDSLTGNTIVMIAGKVREQVGWAPWERQLFDAASSSVSRAMERQSYLLRLETDALKDALTGLGNRRAFDEGLKVEHARARRHQYPFGLMMLDLDGLKSINDESGHEAGDALLTAFGQGLKSSMRVEDRCYRLGGDEFAVLLLHTPTESGEVLHHRVADLMKQVQQQFPRADVSFGLAFFPEEQLERAELIRLADERMYAMKSEHHRATASRPPPH